MNIPDLYSGVRSLYEGRGRPTPCKSNRASQLGYSVPELQGCLRYGVYCRVAWDQAEPWDTEALIRFEEGNRQERHILRDLGDAGFVVVEQQQAFEWTEYQITGHTDGSLLVDNVAIPLECKSAAPAIFSQITDFESLNRKPWLRAYKCQMTLYSLMKNIEWGILLFKDKSSGAMKQINVPLDYELGEYCIRAAERINQHVAAGTLPERILDREVCARCKFRLVCLPEIQFGTPLKLRDDPVYEDRLNRYAELADGAEEAKKLYEIIREEAKAEADGAELNMIVGQWILQGKPDARGAFRLKIERMC